MVVVEEGGGVKLEERRAEVGHSIFSIYSSARMQEKGHRFNLMYVLVGKEGKGVHFCTVGCDK